MAKESMQIHKKPKLQQTKLNFFVTKKPTNDTAPVNNKKRKLVIHESSITDDQQIMPPPKLSPIELIYSEQEIWTRLEIREFLFRFGHLYEFDSRFLGPLQNVQGDWRMKRFGGMIVWRCLDLLSTRSFELSANTKQRAKAMMRHWMEERDILDLYDRPEEQNQAFAEVLQLEGMTASRWQDVVGLIREASEEDVPDIKGSKVIQEDELKITLKLLGLLLFEEGARQSFIGLSKEREAEHKREVKEYHVQESSNKSRRKILSNKVHQLQSLKRKENEMKEVKRQLEELETLIRDECATFHSKKLEFIRQTLKSNKRMQSAGRDKLGNEYWIFNDLMDQACRNSEPYWAYGIIVIGPGYEGHEVKWWAVEGKKEMEKLSKWLKWHHDQEVKSLIESIHQRVDYLNSLEWSIYGEGFFS